MQSHKCEKTPSQDLNSGPDLKTHTLRTVVVKCSAQCVRNLSCEELKAILINIISNIAVSFVSYGTLELVCRIMEEVRRR